MRQKGFGAKYGLYLYSPNHQIRVGVHANLLWFMTIYPQNIVNSGNMSFLVNSMTLLSSFMPNLNTIGYVLKHDAFF